MKISCIQMDMHLGEADYNFARAEELVRAAAEKERPDVAVLPETWNTGFFPKELAPCADRDGERTKAVFSALAKELNINIVCGSVANRRAEGFFNTAYVFDRAGAVVAEYDKTHLFTPSGEHEAFQSGGRTCRFELDGKRCGLIICYDIRFPELTWRPWREPGLSRTRCSWPCATPPPPTPPAAATAPSSIPGASIWPMPETARPPSPASWISLSSRASAPPSTSSGTGGRSCTRGSRRPFFFFLKKEKESKRKTFWRKAFALLMVLSCLK